jgi:DNA-binding MarR family transcriptional regulator
MRRRIEQAVAPTGLRPRELLALQHLQERGPSAQQVLAELVGVDSTNIVAVLNSLEDAGLIDRRRDRTDRRRAIITLSAQGERLLTDLDCALAEIDDDVFASLTGAERDTLNDLLARAVQNIPPRCVQPAPDGCG